MIGGEFAASPNDCGLFLLGVSSNSSNPDCPIYEDYQSFTPQLTAGARNFFMASADALGDWFFWTWKVALIPFKTSYVGFLTNGLKIDLT